MLQWINPRVIAVVLSLALLLQVSSAHSSPSALERDGIACAVLFLVYLLAFLGPLVRTLGFRRLLAPLLALLAAWVAVALALVADALPVSPDIQLQHPWNWPRAVFVIAAGIAFAMFFGAAFRARRLHNEIRQARRGPRPD